MAMTVELLERYMQSEVENLHFRVDTLTDYAERNDCRLNTIERKIDLMYLAIEDLRELILSSTAAEAERQ
jgi:hypothetical protein